MILLIPIGKFSFGVSLFLRGWECSVSCKEVPVQILCPAKGHFSSAAAKQHGGLTYLTNLAQVVLLQDTDLLKGLSACGAVNLKGFWVHHLQATFPLL